MLDGYGYPIVTDQLCAARIPVQAHYLRAGVDYLLAGVPGVVPDGEHRPVVAQAPHTRAAAGGVKRVAATHRGHNPS